MNKIIIDESYNFEKELGKAKTRIEYYEEGILVDIGYKIAKALEEKGIESLYLANKLDISHTRMNNILQGLSAISLEIMVKIAFILGMKWNLSLVDMGDNK